MRKRVYVAGPITKGDMLHNVRQADEAFFALLRAGFAPFNPVWSVFAGSASRWDCQPHGQPPSEATKRVCAIADALSAGTSHSDWMGADLPWVAAADAVLRLPGESVGADLETAHARLAGLPVFTTVDAVVEHFRSATGGPPVAVEPALPADPLADRLLALARGLHAAAGGALPAEMQMRVEVYPGGTSDVRFTAAVGDITEMRGPAAYTTETGRSPEAAAARLRERVGDEDTARKVREARLRRDAAAMGYELTAKGEASP